MEDDLLQRVLAEMAADDPDVARMVESAVEWLTAGEGIGVVDLAGVQGFAWYELRQNSTPSVRIMTLDPPQPVSDAATSPVSTTNPPTPSSHDEAATGAPLSSHPYRGATSGALSPQGLWILRIADSEALEDAGRCPVDT